MHTVFSRTGALIALGLITILPSIVFGTWDDWPHWRGPNRNDKSAETGLLKEWPEGGPQQLWVNNDSGLGYAGIAIVGKQLFTMGMEENREFALCIDPNNGQEIWRTPLELLPEGGPRDGGFLRDWGDGPRCTPSVDGDKVYVLGAGGHLACLGKSDGRKIWSAELVDFGGKIPMWGYSESPLIDGDKLVCTPGGEVGTILALNKKTGEKIWQSKPVTRTLESDGSVTAAASRNYSSVLPIEWNNQRQYIQLTEHAVVSLHPETGEVIWESLWRGKTAVIPSPIFDEGQVYVTSGYNVGSKLIKIGEDNSASEVWYTKDMQNHHGGVIKVGDFFYGTNNQTLVCQSAKDGKKVWATRQIQKGCLGYADGLFYHVQETNGKVTLFDASQKNLAIKSSFVLSPQTERRAGKGMIWTHPVIVNGKLYLRDQNIIYCYDVKSDP